MHQTTVKTKGRQLQRAYKTRWLSSEGTVRARSDILALWAALKQLLENINDEMGIVLLRLLKTISLWCIPFAKVVTSPDRTEQSYSDGIF